MAEVSEVGPRRGVEYQSGFYRRVTWVQERADADLPPWVSEVDGRFFMESEVEEVDE